MLSFLGSFFFVGGGEGGWEGFVDYRCGWGL